MKKIISAIFAVLVIITAVAMTGCNKKDGEIGATEPTIFEDVTDAPTDYYEPTEAYYEPTYEPTEEPLVSEVASNNEGLDEPTDEVSDVVD
ncbi:hypothetical protein AGMMS50284_6450 [Clostridia bacterium]|nr:hypothetical protein AGMMS50284_6450 [Clostridia bacterium]